MTTPHTPQRFIFGQAVGPLAPAITEPPKTPRNPGCLGCASVSRLYQESVMREKDATARNKVLTERVDALESALRQDAPTKATVLDLTDRLHKLAEQEQSTRENAIEQEARLLERALTAERTITNLHIRMRAIGVEP